jgi:membrane associated rhomboid family serine protease
VHASFFAAAGFLAFGFAAFFSAAGFFAAVFFGVLAFLGLAAFGLAAGFFLGLTTSPILNDPEDLRRHQRRSKLLSLTC